MNIQTKYFGELRIDDSTTLRFPDGLFGFEEEKEFVLLPFSEEDDFLLCLQSVKTVLLCAVSGRESRIAEYGESALPDCTQRPNTASAAGNFGGL